MTEQAYRNYNTRLELLALESAPHGVIDPAKDIPFAVLWETMETLDRVIQPEMSHETAVLP